MPASLPRRKWAFSILIMPISVKDELSLRGISVSLGVSRKVLLVLMGAAGLGEYFPISRRRLTQAECDHIKGRIGSYQYWLHKGTPFRRPCVFHTDIAEYLCVHFTTYRRWMRYFGLGRMMPGELGRRSLLPNEVATIVGSLCTRAYAGKGGPL